jgi:hypothetical protein
MEIKKFIDNIFNHKILYLTLQKCLDQENFDFNAVQVPVLQCQIHSAGHF